MCVYLFIAFGMDMQKSGKYSGFYLRTGQDGKGKH